MTACKCYFICSQPLHAVHFLVRFHLRAKCGLCSISSDVISAAFLSEACWPLALSSLIPHEARRRFLSSAERCCLMVKVYVLLLLCRYQKCIIGTWLRLRHVSTVTLWGIGHISVISRCFYVAIGFFSDDACSPDKPLSPSSYNPQGWPFLLRSISLLLNNGSKCTSEASHVCDRPHTCRCVLYVWTWFVPSGVL